MPIARSIVAVRQGGGRVAFGDAARGVFERYRQINASDPEAGGILLGRFVPQSEDVIVDQAVEPMREDKRSRFAYFRPAEPSQRLVDEAWRSTGGVQNYLGEWHTHPEARPVPSKRDLLNWAHILRESTIELSSLFFVIVGISHISIWEGTGELTFHELSQL